MKLRFDNSYAALPERFYSRLTPKPVASPAVIRVNEALAERLGFEAKWLASERGAEFAVGNHILEGSEPIAAVYGGHQFGNWAGQLGDGRAILLGEVLSRDGERFDLQLKGSGRTPYSRGGDGRAPLGPVLREYLVSEAMHALGIPTSRSLVAATTGETVRRETMLPGGVLVRVARSHIRIGTFEFFASRGDTDAIRVLFEHVVKRHFPELGDATVIDLLRAVAERQARLVAQWQLVGFIHGVMNTDNMLLSGETIDYGPCAFMNTYDPETVYSSIDRMGRYAYGNQPRIAQWNLARLAQSLLASTADDELLGDAQGVIDAFPQMFRDAYGQGMVRKLGLTDLREGDWDLIEDLLELMYETESDYTLTFLQLTERVTERFGDALGALPAAFEPWLQRWEARFEADPEPLQTRRELLTSHNPVFIPRNHRVEAAIDAAVGEGNFSLFHELADLLAEPYDYEPTRLDYVRPPKPEEQVRETFCGT